MSSTYRYTCRQCGYWDFTDRKPTRCKQCKSGSVRVDNLTPSGAPRTKRNCRKCGRR